MSNFGFYPALPFGFGGSGSNATYNFVSSGTTVTETITNGSRSTTIIFTETSATSGIYQITPSAAMAAHEAADTNEANEPTVTAPTYQFVIGANGTANVVETIKTSASVETLTYTGGSVLSDELVTVTTPSATTPTGGTVSYSFTSPSSLTVTVANGSISHSGTSVIPGAVFTATATGETEMVASGNSVKTITYVHPTTGPTSAYVIASTDTSFIAQGSAATALAVSPNDRADFAITGSGTSATVTSASPVTSSGTVLTAITPTATNAFAVVSPTTLPAALAGGVFVEVTSTHGTHSYSSLYFSFNGNSGVFTEVASGSTIDVTGVANQLAQIPNALLALL
jgi:hypothetical protein